MSKEYFNKYCRILKQVIKQAKQMSNKIYVRNAEDKTKATWNLVKNITRPNSKKKTVFENFLTKYDTSTEILNNINTYFVNACLTFQTDKRKISLKIE